MGTPDRDTVQRAGRAVQGLSDHYWHKLDAACRLMNEKAWLSPTATGFQRELDARRRALQRELRNAVDALHEAARHAPTHPGGA